VVVIPASGFRKSLHPLHAILLSFPFPLFLGGLLNDFAYWWTAEVQWINFSQWLNAGGLFVAAFVLLWALVKLFRSRRTARKTRPIVYFVVLLAMWALGFVNALVHAKDAWATMPESLYLSAISTLLALVAAWIGYSGFPAEEVR
jgi:uncharacterized membrane protein